MVSCTGPAVIMAVDACEYISTSEEGFMPKGQAAQ
jgi:hypothetical protein